MLAKTALWKENQSYSLFKSVWIGGRRGEVEEGARFAMVLGRGPTGWAPSAIAESVTRQQGFFLLGFRFVLLYSHRFALSQLTINI